MQCVAEGWSEKIKGQGAEGCSISGRVRVNKVIGNIHLSPGRSFQTNAMQVHELVPYLRDTAGKHHNFGHTIETFTFESDDEYDVHKKEIGTELKKRLGIDADPLTGTVATVRYYVISLSRFNSHLSCYPADNKNTIHVSILHKGRLYSVPLAQW